MRAAKITFTRSRPGNSNDRAHVEQKNWAVVRTVVGYHRYDTPAEVRLLNRIWALQSHLTNYFLAQQKLICKTRDGAKVTKKHDVPATPQQRAERHPSVSAEDKTIMEDVLAELNPAATQRQIQALTAELLTLTTSKAAATARGQRLGRRATSTCWSAASSSSGPTYIWWRIREEPPHRKGRSNRRILICRYDWFAATAAPARTWGSSRNGTANRGCCHIC